MSRKYRVVFFILLTFGVVLFLTLLLKDKHLAVLDPMGIIGRRERQLMITASLLSLVVIVPVFIMTFGFAWKYRASNKFADYKPDWDHNLFAESIWWLVPTLLITILGVMTWQSTHELNPYKPLNSSIKPIVIQVVALDWKWLFIYPEKNIATVNYVQFPVNTPVDFQITADAPMNSFWIPQLGGQIYAMTGMSTHLHLMADEVGSFAGSSANISGRGFSGMKFIAQSSSNSDFDEWIDTVKESPNSLTKDEYSALAKPSENNPVDYYGSIDQGLYDWVVMKFMTPSRAMPAIDTKYDSGNANYDHMEGMAM